MSFNAIVSYIPDNGDSPFRHWDKFSSYTEMYRGIENCMDPTDKIRVRVGISDELLYDEDSGIWYET